MELYNRFPTGNKKLFYASHKAFIRNAQLSPGSRLLQGILMSYKGQNKECWPSMGTLSKDLGRNKDSVRKYIKELVSAGYLKVFKRGIGRSHLYAPSYSKISYSLSPKKFITSKPAEKTIQRPDEIALNRSISSGNNNIAFINGKALFDQKRKELGLL